MSKFVDLTGRRYDRLTVIGMTDPYADKSGHKCNRWMCKCDCGGTAIATSGELNAGHTRSCGCLRRDRIRESVMKHGFSKTRLYHIYLGMIDRCFDKTSDNYMNYGGRGITVCDEWKGTEGIKRFIAWAKDSGYSETLSLDRINVNGEYSPSNCRWATNKEQQNNKRDNRYITVGGETKTMKQWAEQYGIGYTTLKQRIYNGWEVEKAIKQPVDKRFSH